MQIGGFNAPALIAEAIRMHSKHVEDYGTERPCWIGIDAVNGCVADMVNDCHVLEVAAVTKSLIISATQAARMIFRVDDIVMIAPRPSPEELGIV